MRNTGLSSELLGIQTGVSGRRIRHIIDEGVEPGPRVKYALAKRFGLIPADIWAKDARYLAPDEIDHLRSLARREVAA